MNANIPRTRIQIPPKVGTFRAFTWWWPEVDSQPAIEPGWEEVSVHRATHGTPLLVLEGFGQPEEYVRFDLFDLLDAAGIHVGFYSQTAVKRPTEVKRGRE